MSLFSFVYASDLYKLDPLLRPLFRNNLTGKTSLEQRQAAENLMAPGILSSRLRRANPNIISAIVKVSGNPGAIESAGARVRTVIGDIITADIPLSSLGKLIELPNISYIQLSRQREPAMLDISVPDTGADQAWQSVPGYTGKGTIVGIIDQGIDWRHPDFNGSDGTSRILYIWDQTWDTQGRSRLEYGYGTEWTKNDIDSGRCDEMDGSGHGTHVTSTAAGDGRKTHGFTGVAPEASIIFVKTWFGDAEIIDACDYIFGKAAELGIPAVINMSFGGHWGPHDGTDSLDKAIDEMLNVEGRAVVIAAGNDGNAPVHLGTTSMRYPSGNRYPWAALRPLASDRLVFTQIWYPPEKTLSVRVLLPKNRNGDLEDIGPGWFHEEDGDIEFIVPQGPLTGAMVNLSFQPASPFVYPDFNGIYVYIHDDGDLGVPIDDYNYVVEFDGGGTRMDAYMLRGIGFATSPSSAVSLDTSFFLSGNDTSSVLSPGSSERGICVASYVTRDEWIDSENRLRSENLAVGGISAFSSRGPLLNGLQKPDIAAPGEMIIAAFSSDAWARPKNIYQDQSHVAFRGTSMSSPHVTGAVALLFQQNPKLTARGVKELLNGSAIDTGNPGWDKAWGYGKMDVLAALGIPSIPYGLRATADSETITVEWSPNQENDIAGYRIYRLLADGNWTLDTTIQHPTSRIQYQASDIQERIKLAVSAYDKNGNEGAKSKEITIFPKTSEPDTTPPTPPEDLTVSPMDSALNLKWSPCDEYDLVGYRIYYGDSSGNYDKDIRVGNTTEYRIYNLSNGSRIYVAVSAIDTSGNESDKSVEAFGTPMVLPKQALRYQSGWPVSVEHDVYSSPTIYDIDGDGKMEVSIASRDGKVYLLNSNGSNVRGWPADTDSNCISSPAVADVDKDGRTEIVVASGSKLYMWHDDGSLMAGWPIRAMDNFVATPALGDIDGDGELEIVIGSRDKNIYAYNPDGSNVKGWPIKAGSYVHASAALGDINRDNKLEIVVCDGDGTIYVFDGDGKRVSGWPVDIGFEIFSSPALGDIDGDGYMEIVTADMDGYVYALNYDGTMCNGWPIDLREEIDSSPALGDLNNDAKALEVVIGTQNGSLYVLLGNGRIMDGWPVSIEESITASPALGDVDGDGKTEIIVASNTLYGYVGLLYAFETTGKILGNLWPAYTEGNIDYSSPALGDLDGDGDIEIVAGSCRYYASSDLKGGRINVWDLTGRVDTDKIAWGGFRNDPGRTGAAKDGYPPHFLILVMEKDLITKKLDIYAAASEKLSQAPMLRVELGKEKKLVQSIQMAPTGINPLIYRANFVIESYGEYTFTVNGEDLGGNSGTVSKTMLIKRPVQDSVRDSAIPKEFSLLPNYPNPFNPGTWIPYELPEASDVTIEVYSLDGRLMRSLKIGHQSPGDYISMNKAAYWDGRDDHNEEVASGVYFYALRAGQFKAIRKMILSK